MDINRQYNNVGQHQNGTVVFAIVGHRDIPVADVTILAASIKSILLKAQEEHPDSHLVLLSGLAEGADRIAVCVALECGVELGAVLPMEEEDYRGDFVDQNSQPEFDRLLGKAAWQVVVQPEDVIDLTNSAQRDLCYAAVGEYFCSHAHQLIALWDGQVNGEVGGTADVVQEFRSGCDKGKFYGNDSLLDSFDDGLVLHIWTRRENTHNNVQTENQVGTCRELRRYSRLAAT